MAIGNLGTTEKEAVFNLYFRKNPFQGGYTVACGLEYVVDFLKNLSFDKDELAYLSSLKGNDGKALFEQGFLDYLADMKFECDIDAVPEGTVVFPNEPLLRVKGPLFQCQLIETPLLTMLNFQTLIATKAARLCQAADQDEVLEFGMRRAQGIDGALAASRAAYIGGCSATSNVLAGKLFGIPVKGTHAHSWIMSFDTEMEAFETYAEAMPNNAIFLVDTYDTIEGVKKAVQVGKKLREKGYEMAGIRLDSGDLAYLSIEARKIMDEAGFPKAKIVASNDLNEHIITSLKNEQGAKIDIWGVGTKLATAFDQPALGGVYKLSAIENDNKEWDYKVKLSEQAVKVSNPGILQTRRYYYENGSTLADMIFDENNTPTEEATIIDPLDNTRRKKVNQTVVNYKDLLVPIFRRGNLVYGLPTIEEMRKMREKELETFHPSIKRLSFPHAYPVGLEHKLYEIKNDLIMKLRGN